MSDLALSFDGETLTSDIAFGASDLATDDGLATAVIISLFTDARARPEDLLPDDTRAPGETIVFGSAGGNLTRYRRGWWGDLVPPPQAADATGHRTGSRLWLLSREKQTAETLHRAEEYAREALQWLIADGVARAVQVEAFIPRAGWLGLRIMIDRPRNHEQFEYVWATHAV